MAYMSGIYIKDVKLPDDKPGAFAAIVLYVDKDGQLHATGTHQMEVIPVPDHGDLIDRDIVAKDVQEMSESVEKDFPYMDRNDNLMIERGITFARQYVLNLAPAVVPADKED